MPRAVRRLKAPSSGFCIPLQIEPNTMLNVWCSMHSIQDSNILFAMRFLSLNEFTIPVTINLWNAEKKSEQRVQKKRTRKKNVENFTLYALIHLGVFFCCRNARHVLYSKSQILCLNRISVRPTSLINITKQMCVSIFSCRLFTHSSLILKWLNETITEMNEMIILLQTETFEPLFSFCKNFTSKRPIFFW